MKITIVQGAFLPVPPQLGGAVEKMWFALGKEFAKRGHQVVHISRHYANSPVQEVIAGVLHKRIRGFASPSSGLRLKLLDLIYSIKAKSVIPQDSEIIVTNTFWAPIIIHAKLKEKCFVDVQRMPKGQMKLYKKVARLRANSNFVAEAIRREITFSEGGKVVMIPNPLPFEIKEEVDFKQKKPMLLYVGRIHPEKGLDLLIRAYKRLQTHWVLKIIGPYDVAAGGGGASYMNSLIKMSEGLNIEFVGPVYDVNVLNMNYMEASVFVYPSVAEQGETFGLAPLEAMAWGCVPIVSNLSCFHDFIQNGTNGLTFDHRADNAIELLKEAISKVLSDIDLTVSLAINAVEVRKTHSVSLIGCHFLNEFQKIIS